MKPGNFILVQGSGIIGNGIGFAERNSFTHAAVVSGTNTIIEATAHGIQENILNYERYAVFEFLNASEGQLAGIVEYARSHLGEGYGWLQDLGFAINGLLEDVGHGRIPGLFLDCNHPVCSAFVDLAARSQGIIARLDRVAGDVTPPGLMFSPEVRFIENHSLREL